MRNWVNCLVTLKSFSDTKRFMELSREEANTRETVTAYREYKQVIQSISDAEEMIKEASGDPDLEEMG